ncbi:MAG: hypothetical protein QOG72_2428 [Sphingomonadales bacterium]|jgi:hypothetical protein|nr:hypothetical protein [Sphingomonadales bacterium]
MIARSSARYLASRTAGAGMVEIVRRPAASLPSQPGAGGAADPRGRAAASSPAAGREQ